MKITEIVLNKKVFNATKGNTSKEIHSRKGFNA